MAGGDVHRGEDISGDVMLLAQGRDLHEKNAFFVRRTARKLPAHLGQLSGAQHFKRLLDLGAVGWIANGRPEGLAADHGFFGERRGSVLGCEL